MENMIDEPSSLKLTAIVPNDGINDTTTVKISTIVPNSSITVCSQPVSECVTFHSADTSAMFCSETLSVPNLATIYSSTDQKKLSSYNSINKNNFNSIVFSDSKDSSDILTADSYVSKLSTAALTSTNGLKITSLSEINSSENDNTAQHDLGHVVNDTRLDLNEVVSNDNEAGKNSVVSSSMDEVVTSFIKEHSTLISNEEKLESHVVLKLIDPESLELDVVRLISQQQIDHTFAQQDLDVLNTKPSTPTVQIKLDNGLVNNIEAIPSHNKNHQLNPTTLISTTTNNGPACSVVWICAYCNLCFETSDAVTKHQEKGCPYSVPQTHFERNNNCQNKIGFLLSTEDDITERVCAPPNKYENIHLENDEINNCNYDVVWMCAVCSKDFGSSDDLHQHHISHTVQELSLALLKVTKPFQKPKLRIDKNIAKIPLKSPSDKLSKEPNTKKHCFDDLDKVIQTKDKITTNIIVRIEKSSLELTPKNICIARSVPTPIENDLSKTDLVVKKHKTQQSNSKDIKKRKQKRVRKPGMGSRDPHTCTVCHKVLCSRGNLSKHMVIHNIQKPWVCHICRTGFNTKRDYQYHYKLRHTNERPFHCTICAKGFVLLQDLNMHESFHKPSSFICDICGKFYSSAKCVKRHKKRHNKGQHSACSICFKVFNSRADVTSHIRKVHKKKLSLLKPVKLILQKGQHEPVLDCINKKTATSINVEIQQPMVHGSVKNEDISEFLLPSITQTEVLSQQVLPVDLTNVTTTKDSIILNNPLTVSLPISDTNDERSCSYGVTLDHNSQSNLLSQQLRAPDTYVMIRSEIDPTPQVLSSTHGLDIITATSTVPLNQDPCDSLAKEYWDASETSRGKLKKPRRAWQDLSLTYTYDGREGHLTDNGDFDTIDDLPSSIHITQLNDNELSTSNTDDLPSSIHITQLNDNDLSTSTTEDLPSSIHITHLNNNDLTTSNTNIHGGNLLQHQGHQGTITSSVHHLIEPTTNQTSYTSPGGSTYHTHTQDVDNKEERFNHKSCLAESFATFQHSGCTALSDNNGEHCLISSSGSDRPCQLSTSTHTRLSVTNQASSMDLSAATLTQTPSSLPITLLSQTMQLDLRET